MSTLIPINWASPEYGSYVTGHGVSYPGADNIISSVKYYMNEIANSSLKALYWPGLFNITLHFLLTRKIDVIILGFFSNSVKFPMIPPDMQVRSSIDGVEWEDIPLPPKEDNNIWTIKINLSSKEMKYISIQAKPIMTDQYRNLFETPGFSLYKLQAFQWPEVTTSNTNAIEAKEL